MVYGALIKRLVLSELILDQYWTTDKLYYARWDAIAMFLPLNLCSVVYCFFYVFLISRYAANIYTYYN